MLQSDASDQMARIGLQPQRPVPFLAARDRRQRNVADVGQRPVRRVRPRDDAGHEPNDFPVRKENLDRLSIRQLERLQYQPRGVENGGHERERQNPEREPRTPNPEPRRYAYAAPTMIFLIRMCGDPCEILLVCVGWPFASPPVPNIFHVSWLPMRSRFAQKS